MRRSLALIVVLAMALTLFAMPIYACDTPGYWKNHLESWDNYLTEPPAPDDEFINGPEGFTWRDALGTPPRGDIWYILARAYAASYLNGFAEWDTPAGDAVRAAGDLLEAYDPGTFVKGSWDLELARFYAKTLDNWNNDIWGE